MSATQKLLGGRYKFIQTLNTHPSGHTFLAADVHQPGHPKCVVRELYLPTRNPRARRFILRLLKQKVAVLKEIGQHQQIPHTLAAFDIEQSFYLVQEFVQGRSLLEDLALSPPWTATEAVEFLQAVLPVLAFAQDHGVVHGNLKPSKLIRHQPENQLMVLDFGSMKHISQHMARDRQRAVDASLAPYRAPEQLQNQTRFCSDYYALGMIVIQALTGRSSGDLPTAQTPGRHDVIASLLQQTPDLPPALSNVLRRMVHSLPERRYQKATEILRDLNALTASPDLTDLSIASGPPPDETPLDESWPRSRRSWPGLWWSAGGLLALIAITAIVILKLPQRLAAQRHLTTAEAVAAANPAAAIADYTQALSLLPNQPATLAERSRLYFEVGNTEGALADISEAIAQAPDNPRYSYDRANLRFAVGDVQGAINDYSQAIDLDPTFTKAYVNRGSARADWGDDRGAIDDYSQAIELATQTATEAAAYLNRCLSYSNLGEQELALSDCSAAINLRPSHALAYQNRGLVRRRLGDLQGSLQDYNIAIQIEPNSPDPYYNRALTRQALSDLPGAMEDLSRAIAIAPDFVFALYDRGLLHAEMNNSSAALADLKTASQLCLDLGRTGCYEDAQFQITRLQNAAPPDASQAPASTASPAE